MRKFKCKICGYVYIPENGDSTHGIKEKTLFENLPKNWLCPICGAPKEYFTGESIQ
jgi:rubredoxin